MSCYFQWAKRRPGCNGSKTWQPAEVVTDEEGTIDYVVLLDDEEGYGEDDVDFGPIITVPDELKGQE